MCCFISVRRRAARYGICGLLAATAAMLSACSGETLPVTNITATSADFNASASCDGTPGRPCFFGFEYTSAGVTYRAPRHGPIGDTKGPVTFNEHVENLTPGTSYDVSLCGQGDDNVREWTCSNAVSFTTDAATAETDSPPYPETPPDADEPSAPDVDVPSATDLDEPSAGRDDEPSGSDGDWSSGDDTGAPPSHSGNDSARVVGWAVRHVGWWAGRFSRRHPLPRTRDVAWMARHAPPRGRGPRRRPRQGCDAASFVRWAYAQAGVDVGTNTARMWTANGMLGRNDRTSASTDLPTGRVSRGWGRAAPPGGWREGDLVFYGVERMLLLNNRGRAIRDTRGSKQYARRGHVAIYMGDGQIVQCSGPRSGSNRGRTLDSPTPRRTGWLRYDSVSG